MTNISVQIFPDKSEYYPGDSVDGYILTRWQLNQPTKVRYNFNIYTSAGTIKQYLSPDIYYDITELNGEILVKLSDVFKKWGEFPIIIEEGFPPGEYYLDYSIFDENYKMLAQSIARFIIVHRQTSLNDLVEFPIAQNLENWTIEDWQLLSQMPRRLTALILSVLTYGQSGVIAGMDLEVEKISENGKDEYYVNVTPGVALQYIGINDDFQVAPGKLGTHLIFVTEKARIGKLSDHPANQIIGETKDRYDPLSLQLDYIKTGDSADDLKSNRYFRNPTTNAVETRQVETRVRSSFKLLWDDPNRFIDKPVNRPDWITIGWVRIKDGANTLDSKDVFKNTFSPIILQHHRTKTPLDHPLGSINAQHLKTTITGGYEGSPDDLTLKQMSDWLVEMCGDRNVCPSPNFRISKTIDPAGTLIEAILGKSVVESIVNLLDGIIDEQGTLTDQALRNLRDKFGEIVPYRLGIWVGDMQASDSDIKSQCKIPPGFDFSECVAFWGDKNIYYVHQSGKPWRKLSNVDNEGNVDCRVIVAEDSETEQTYYCTVRVAVIGIKPII